MKRDERNEPKWRRYLRFWRRDPTADLDAELQFHFARRIAEFEAAGMSPPDAAAAARARFGDVDAVRNDLAGMDARIVHRSELRRIGDGVRADLRYVFRGLRRTPGFSAAVLITLAIGIGLNAALFSFLDRAFVRAPEGVLAPREVRRVFEELSHTVTTHGSHVMRSTNYLNYAALRDAFAPTDVAAYVAGDSVIVDHDASVLTKRSYVSANFFSLLGVRPTTGRAFASDEAAPERPVNVAVISDALWHRRFGGDPGIVGRRIEIDDEQFTVIGVAPRGFSGIDLDRVDVWTPLGTIHASSWRPGQPWYGFGGPNFLQPIARSTGRLLLPLEAKATARLDELNTRNHGGDSITKVVDGPIVGALGPDEQPGELSVSIRIGAVAAIILLIACANVANLLMLRTARRSREIAVRRALGISAARLRGLVLLESLVLAGLGGLLAVVVALWGGTLLRRLLLPRTTWAGGAVDPRVIAFLGLVAVIVAILAGIAPAIASSNPDVMSLLRRGAGDAGSRGSRLRSTLVVVQTALSVVLLVGAALFVRSLRNLKAVDVGYDAGQVAFTSIYLNGKNVDLPATTSELDRIATAMRAFPGVTGTAVASSTPLRSTSGVATYLPGADSALHFGSLYPWTTAVTPDFFATAGVARIAGQTFSGSETAASEPVVVVSQRFAKMTWPGRSPLGECLLLKSKSAPCARVVGVVADVHTMHIVEDPEIRCYVPLAQSPFKLVPSIVIRAAPASMGRAIAELDKRIAGVIPTGATVRAWTVDEAFASELRPWVVGSQLFVLLGLIAVVVASVGVYSVVLYSMRQRANEIGIRIALGAKSGDIFALAARSSVAMLGIGVVLGILTSAALGRFVASLLFGVTTTDALSLASAAALLLAVGALASAVPAWRASQIDPVQTLKAE